MVYPQTDNFFSMKKSLNSSAHVHEATRAARLETWADYLCIPIRYIRQKMRDVTEKEDGRDQQGNTHRNVYYKEEDIAHRIPEYEAIMELKRLGKSQTEIRNSLLSLFLTRAGYEDRRALEKENPENFIKKDFGPFGKGKKFFFHVTGEKGGPDSKIEKEHIPKLAEVLHLPNLSEARKAEMRILLLEAGYSDGRSLEKGVRQFHLKSFGRYGKGKKFFGWITGENVSERHLVKEDMKTISDILEIPEMSEERINEMKMLLTAAGYTDRRSLELDDVQTFLGSNFGHYGKGKKFYSWVTGESGESGYLDRKDLAKVANMLGLPILSEGRKAEMLRLLVEAGFCDRRNLELRIEEFCSHVFGAYGNGAGFYRWATALPSKKTKKEDFLKIAEIFELRELSETTKNEMRAALLSAGYPDRNSLQKENILVFIYKDFGRFGKAKNFFCWVTGKKLGVSGNMKKEYLNIIADALELPDQL